jgi:hypothetical protein
MQTLLLWIVLSNLAGKLIGMKKSLLLLLMAAFLHTAAFAQDEGEPGKKGFDKSKLFFGGNFGLSFGDFTFINISPQVGYRFNQFLAAGAGINMQYISIKERFIDGSPFAKTSRGAAGLNIFGRVYPVEYIMLQAQPELNYVFGKIKYYNPSSEINAPSKIVPSFLVGAGAVIPSGRGAFIASVFYDVIQDQNSPYSTRPFFNFGFNTGF